MKNKSTYTILTIVQRIDNNTPSILKIFFKDTKISKQIGKNL